MNIPRAQVLIALAGVMLTPVGGLVLWGVNLSDRVGRLEERVINVEAAVIEDKKIMAAEIIELLKIVHELRGAKLRITTDERGAR